MAAGQANHTSAPKRTQFPQPANAAQGTWVCAGWLAALLAVHFAGVVLAWLMLLAGGSTRLLVLTEAGVVALAATGRLDGAEIPVLAVAMAIQNQAARHGGLDANVGFVTGDIQQLGQQLVRGHPEIDPKPTGRPTILLTVLALYGIGAAIGVFATSGDVAMLVFAAATIAAAGLLPGRWTGIRQRH